jgi:uncharacterized protein YdeI (YjbR/CyaY-like superfamily)
VPKDDLEIIAFDSPEAWERWLDEHHESSPGIWMKIAKKHTGIPTVVWKDAVPVALCFGWIDGQADKLDDDWYLQRYTPRRPRSKWSKINRDHAERLIKAGRMRPAGQRAIDSAKADGRWDAAYDAPSTATVPPDLQQQLDANPDAKEFFATLSGNNRYAILYRIQDAKRPETRARRIEKFVQMLKEKKTLH